MEVWEPFRWTWFRSWGIFKLKVFVSFFPRVAHLPQCVRGWDTDSLSRAHHGEDRWYGWFFAHLFLEKKKENHISPEVISLPEKNSKLTIFCRYVLLQQGDQIASFVHYLNHSKACVQFLEPCTDLPSLLLLCSWLCLHTCLPSRVFSLDHSHDLRQFWASSVQRFCNSPLENQV